MSVFRDLLISKAKNDVALTDEVIAYAELFGVLPQLLEFCAKNKKSVPLINEWKYLLHSLVETSVKPFLVSEDNAYIDTKITYRGTKNEIHIELTYEDFPFHYSTGIFGMSDNYGTPGIKIETDHVGGVFCSWDWERWNVQSRPWLFENATWVFDKGSWTSNGTVVGTTSYADTRVYNTSTYSLFLFAVNGEWRTPGSIETSNRFTGKINSFKVDIKKNSYQKEQHYHFAPYYKNGEYGMVDIKSGIFYGNAFSTGSFKYLAEARLTDEAKTYIEAFGKNDEVNETILEQPHYATILNNHYPALHGLVETPLKDYLVGDGEAYINTNLILGWKKANEFDLELTYKDYYYNRPNGKNIQQFGVVQNQGFGLSSSEDYIGNTFFSWSTSAVAKWNNSSTIYGYDKWNSKLIDGTFKFKDTILTLNDNYVGTINSDTVNHYIGNRQPLYLFFKNSLDRPGDIDSITKFNGGISRFNMNIEADGAHDLQAQKINLITYKKDGEFGMVDTYTNVFYPNVETSGSFGHHLQKDQDYYILDYIESDGNQYIVTDIQNSNYHEVEGTFEIGDNGSRMCGVIGTRSGASRLNISTIFDSNNVSVDYTNSSYSSTRLTVERNAVNGKKVRVKMSNYRQECYIDDELYDARERATEYANNSWSQDRLGGMQIFNIEGTYGDGARFSNFVGKFYNVKVYYHTYGHSEPINMELKNYLLPCYVPRNESDCQLGMLDIKTNKFYPNCGSGNFTFPITISHPYTGKTYNDYIQDGLVFQLDCTTKCNAQYWQDTKGGKRYDNFLRPNFYRRPNMMALKDFAPYFENFSAYATENDFLNMSILTHTFEIVFKPSVIMDSWRGVLMSNSSSGDDVGLEIQNGDKYAPNPFPNRHSVPIFQSALEDKLAVRTVTFQGEQVCIENGEDLSISSYYSSGLASQITGTCIGGPGNISNYFEGNIYAIRVYNRLLTKEEILQNQAVDEERFKIDLHIPNNFILYKSNWKISDSTLTSRYFGATMTSHTFVNGNGQIVFDGDVTMVGNYAFASCGFTSVKLPNSVTTIGQYAFQYCRELISVEIPSGVTTVAYHAFDTCSKLFDVTCRPTTPPVYGAGVFQNATVAKIYVPSESVEAYKSASGWSDYADKIFAIE